MRCIEIHIQYSVYNRVSWLTLTWDVLKYQCKLLVKWHSRRLTLTWDVLKYYIFSKGLIMEHWLTLTWDVLKSKSKPANR